MNKEKVAWSFPGNPHSNLENVNMNKEKVTGNPPTNRENVNREKNKKINKI